MVALPAVTASAALEHSRAHPSVRPGRSPDVPHPLDSRLRRLARALQAVRATLERVSDLVDPTEFYDVYRPLLGGWSADKLASGLRLPGVGPADDHPAAEVPSEDGAALLADVTVDIVSRHKGPSAGQTAILLLVDRIMGVTHGAETAAFQAEMRGYLPAPHAALLADVDERVCRWGSVGDAARDPDAPEALRRAHGEALNALAAMRAFHLGMASRYLRRTNVGTGASDFRAMLGEALRSTRASRV